MQNLQTIDFHGDEIKFYQNELGKVSVSLVNLCNNLGINLNDEENDVLMNSFPDWLAYVDWENAYFTLEEVEHWLLYINYFGVNMINEEKLSTYLIELKNKFLYIQDDVFEKYIKRVAIEAFARQCDGRVGKMSIKVNLGHLCNNMSIQMIYAYPTILVYMPDLLKVLDISMSHFILFVKRYGCEDLLLWPHEDLPKFFDIMYHQYGFDSFQEAKYFLKYILNGQVVANIEMRIAEKIMESERKMESYNKADKYTHYSEFIYFIQNTESKAIKIGFSKKVKARLQGLQDANSAKLKLIKAVKGSLEEEKKLHNKLEEFRVKGEWYRPHPKLLKFINDIKDLPTTKQSEVPKPTVFEWPLGKDHMDIDVRLMEYIPSLLDTLLRGKIT